MPTPRAAATTQSLYLVRHGIAAEGGEAWPDDTKRPLTSKGIARFRQVARGLREIGVEVEVVLSSPLVRAKQTAELLIDGLKPAPSLTVLSALSPGVPPSQLAEALQSHRKAEALALVGHEPGLGEFGAWLVGAKTPLALKKGGVCRIDCSVPTGPGAGQLVWLAPPKMLRRLG